MQGTLAPERQEKSDSEIMHCKDMRCAIRLCVENSGLQPKEIAFLVSIHKEHFSRMYTTTDEPRHFPVEQLPKLMSVCGNEIPLRWLALNNGYGLVRLKSAVELENERLRLENDQLKRDHEVIKGFLREVKL